MWPDRARLPMTVTRGTSVTKVYLVGYEKAPKTNSWQAMTNDKAAALRMMAENPKLVSFKEVEVRDRARKKN